MEKRIKALYIITIIAIIFFLGMQMFWLYGRYELNLDEYEQSLNARVAECVDRYYDLREISSKERLNDSSAQKTGGKYLLPYYRSIISINHGPQGVTSRKIIVYSYEQPIKDILGPSIIGSGAAKQQIQELTEKIDVVKELAVDSTVYEAAGAKDETDAWKSFQNILLENRIPFTIEGIDSVLKKAGIKAEVSLAKADSMVWRPVVNYHKWIFKPELSMVIPYSQLEGKIVRILCPISPFDVLPGMWLTLLLSLLVSALLIVCLALQFSTVLKLSRLDKMRNSFITTMIHELKRPISTLKMCVSGIENAKMMEEPAMRKELMAKTRTALDNLSAYFSKLRDIIFNDVEQIPLNIQSINLRQLFAAVAGSVAMPSEKEVAFTNDIGGDITVSADRSHLFNILTNLVENALKYSGNRVAIRASVSETAAGNVEIRITDNGYGIAAGDLRHIFNRFYRGKRFVQELPGMGLGLTYVKLLVDAHGGEVKAESTVGQGSCFTIILPQ